MLPVISPSDEPPPSPAAHPPRVRPAASRPAVTTSDRDVDVVRCFIAVLLACGTACDGLTPRRTAERGLCLNGSVFLCRRGWFRPRWTHPDQLKRYSKHRSIAQR